MPLSKGAVSIITVVITAVASLGAAWITAGKGLVSFPNPALERQVSDLKQKLENHSKLAGDFEWQWAGDNWLGSVKFQNLADGTMSAVTEMRVVKSDPRTQYRTIQDSVAFHSTVDGTASVNNQSVISFHMPIEVTEAYLKAHHTKSKNVVLDGELQPVDAFAGRVRFTGEEANTGDIILVRYRSDARRW